MRYDHAVKHNGITYPAGTDVPNGKSAELANDVPAGAQEEAGKQLTKTEINRMAVEDLRKLAAENGIKNVEEISGADLKKVLIEKLDL